MQDINLILKDELTEKNQKKNVIKINSEFDSKVCVIKSS